MSDARRSRIGLHTQTAAERADRLPSRPAGRGARYEHRHAGALQPCLQFRLGAVDDHEVGLEREDSLGVGIEQAADARQLAGLRRKRSKLPTPTRRSPAPIAKIISVVAGMSRNDAARPRLLRVRTQCQTPARTKRAAAAGSASRAPQQKP